MIQNKFQHYDFIESNLQLESELLNLIEAGNTQGLAIYLERPHGSKQFLTRQPRDPLRNAKNGAIGLNAIVIRAARKGGLSPHLTYGISTNYSIGIEKCGSVESVHRLCREMLTEYCEGVKRYSLEAYSPLIKNAIVMIRENLHEHITLSEIAGNIHVSKSHLSRLFFKEIGMNVTAYINTTKIHESLPYVKSKNYSLDDIAGFFNYCNTAYYCRMFKKVMGISPGKYQTNADY